MCKQIVLLIRKRSSKVNMLALPWLWWPVNVEEHLPVIESLLHGKSMILLSSATYNNQFRPVTAIKVHTATRRDLLLSKVLHQGLAYIGNNPIFEKSDELSREEGCCFGGRRVINPKYLQHDIMQEQKIHKEHMGVSKMRNLARDHIWWLGIIL